MPDYSLSGTGGDDTFVIAATGLSGAEVFRNGTDLGTFNNITQLNVSGLGGNDTITILNPAGGLFAPTSGITIDGGGQPGDALQVLGGVSNSGLYVPGATPDAGSILHFVNETQQVTVDAVSGTFTLTFNGVSTGSLAFNASAAAVQAALNGLASIGGQGGSVAVTQAGSTYTVTFGGTMSEEDENQMIATGAGGAAATVTTLIDGGTQNISFTGLAPVTDTVIEPFFQVYGTQGADTISVADGPFVFGGTQTTTVSSPTFESVSFGNKTTVAIAGNGGTDSISFNNPTLASGLTTLNVAGVDTVTQTGALNVPNLSISANGNVTLNNSGNNVGTLAATAGGTFSFSDASPLSIGTVGAIVGITAINHGITITADNLDVQQQINAGVIAGTVTLQSQTAGRVIDLGGADTVGHLGLTDAELDHVTATSLRVGNSSAGTISISAPITPALTSQLELTTGADIQTNNVVFPDIGVARLAMTAGTGIGVTGLAHINTNVGNLEAQTTTGGIDITNFGPLVIGSVTPTLQGLKVVTSGDIKVVNSGGDIVLDDTSGPQSVTGGASSGNVLLWALGAHDVTANIVDNGAIFAPHGNASIVAGRDILLGTLFNSGNYVLADGQVTLDAGRDITIDGASLVISDDFSHNTGGSVFATAGQNLAISNAHGNSAFVGAGGSAAGAVTLTAGANDFVAVTPAGNAVVSLSGDVTINADRVLIDPTSGILASTPGRGVTIQPVSADWAVNLGSTSDAAANTLELSDAELDRVSTLRLRIGSASSTGDVTLTSQITADGHYDTMSLRSGGAILDGTAAEQTDITVNKLALQAATGIGSGGAGDIDTAVSNVVFGAGGDVSIFNTGALTITPIDGLAAANSGGAADVIVAGGALTVAGNVTAGINVLLQTQDTAAAGEDLTVLGGVTVQSTAAPIQLVAGDNLTLQAGSTMQTASNIQAQVDFTGGDPGVGGTGTFNGTLIGSPIDFFGQADNDILIGSAANEVFHGGTGADTMQGGGGSDTYFVDNAGDVVTEGANAGTDTVNSSINYALPANVEGLVLLGSSDLQGYGNGLVNTVIGNSGNNLIDGGIGADTMVGLGGSDSYFVDNAGDVATESGNAGSDTVYSTVNYTLSANIENLVIQGSADLQGYGNGLVNAIFGNTGSNLIDGGGGADSMTGGAGNDTYFVDNIADSAFENANEGNDTVFASVDYTLSANVENLIMQGSADLQGYGNGLANVIYGNSGNNLINGGGGPDLMVGGAGNDTYFFDNIADSAFENTSEGNDTVFVSVNYGLAADVENLIIQGSADLQGYGSNQANVIYGNSGNNLINAGGGIDLMVGGAGNDTYFVDDPGDSCFEVPGQGNDAVFAFCNYGLAADVETLVLQSSADYQGYGNNQVNTLYGNSGNNLLNGGGGADAMQGGAGNDTYFVDNVGDVVFESANEGSGDTVLSGVSYTLTANVEALVLQGAGNLNGTGNGIANSLFGNTGDNTLDGGGSSDQLTGNAGNDTFVFRPVEGNGDTIADFAGNGLGVGDSLQFVGYGGGATFTNIDTTHWQVNYNGGSSHDIITFSNSPTIDPTDFGFF
jgi:trimeric autotransporter adhesin